MSTSVLIIDDSVTVREQIIRTLESFNLFSRYHEAEDGLEGFKSYYRLRLISFCAIWRCRASMALSF